MRTHGAEMAAWPLCRRGSAVGFRALHLAGVLLTGASLPAADLTDVRPVSSKILQIEITDGKVRYHNSQGQLSDNVVYHNPVDLMKAMTVSNYTVQSTDDANYSSAKSATNIGRKSRPLYFNDPYDPSKPTYVMGHRIYIELPYALVAGKTYTITLLSSLTQNRSTVRFVYDVNTLRSETVHVNQIGFAPGAVKVGYLSHWMGSFNTATHPGGGLNLDDRTGAQFRLINYATGATAYTGTISKRMAKTVQETANTDFDPEKNYSLADVWECDFSALATSGEYVLAVDGIGCSYPFVISADVGREPFYYAMKGLFYQRQGIVKDIGEGRTVPRDHHPDDIAWKYDANWPGGEDVSTFNPNAPRLYGAWGFYHDAGDWDHYPVHAHVPFMLMMLYELNPSKFRDGDVGNRYKLAASDPSWIDEGSNGIPDLLDEAAWLLNGQKRTKDSLIAQSLGTGGVPGYVGRDAIEGLTASWQDTRPWYVSQENIEATYKYAAMSAWYARCLNAFYQLSHPGQNHPDYNTWKTEAQNAWIWANARDTANSEQREIASCLMYCLTGDTAYQTIYKTLYNWDPSAGNGEWAGLSICDAAMGAYALLPATHPGLDSTFQTTVRNRIIGKADTRIADITRNGFRCSLDYWQFMGLGAFSTVRATPVIYAHKLTGNAKYLNALQHAMNYQFGGNQLNTVYLSNLGEQPLKAVFAPDGWYANRAGSYVYDDEMFDGYTTYFGGVTYWFTESIFSERYTRAGTFPLATNVPNVWPESESDFMNRYSIQGSEFTIHQNNNHLAFTTGYLNSVYQTSATPYSPNPKPTVSLNLTDGQQVPANATLTATASANTRRVRYYYDWHLVGESTDKANSFPVALNSPLPAGTGVLITAMAFNDAGRVSLWSDGGDKSVTIAAADTTAPALVSTSISAGAAQRSMVKDLTVIFSEPVTLSPTAIAITTSTGQGVTGVTTAITNPSGDRKTYLLSFSGTAVIGGSLPDGVYDLIVSASAVQDVAGNVMTGNYSQRFHRLFGDSDGNKVVNALDYVRLKNTLGRASSDPLFSSAFDYEANNLVNALDLARFRQRYGLSFSY